jgi:tRNA (cmo5U34)-methyltransferase
VADKNGPTLSEETQIPPTPQQRDRLFSEARARIDDFDFGANTSMVFDDMLDRSVPFYQEIQRMVAEVAVDFAADGTNVYDLGCSTANTIMRIGHGLPADKNVRFVGIDSSQEMLDVARGKLVESNFRHDYALELGDLNGPFAIENASVVLLVLTLQFVRPLYREHLIQSIYDGLEPNGCLILVEKVLGEHSTFNRLFINHYYELKKRNGYSQLEIAQKREALENVLIPYRLEENKELLRGCGFRNIDVFFKWYNFCSIVAMK